jgi:hypothetical protein
VLQVGHLERFNPGHPGGCDQLSNPRFIESNRLAPFKPRGTDVSVVLDLMIHDIDLIEHVVRSPIASIDAIGAPVFTDEIDIANARIRFANGCVADVTASRISLKAERKLRVFQADAYLSIDLQQKLLSIVRKPASFGDGALPKVDLEERSFEQGDALQDEIRSFVTPCAAARARRLWRGRPARARDRNAHRRARQPRLRRPDRRVGRPGGRYTGQLMQPTNTADPDYYHKVVDCQWACPSHTDVPEYIRLIAQGRYSDAYMVNRESNVFPGILGRVCDRPCEPACRRRRVEEKPVAICRLKRVASDLRDDITSRLPKAPARRERPARRPASARGRPRSRSRTISCRSATKSWSSSSTRPRAASCEPTSPRSACPPRSSTRKSATSSTWAPICASARRSPACASCWPTAASVPSSSGPARRKERN